MDKTTCILSTFLSQGTKKGLEGKSDMNLWLTFSCTLDRAARDFPTARFYDHLMFDNDTEQGTDSLYFLREPVLK